MIPLFKPYIPELPDIMPILKSGKLSFGKYGREFESILSNYLGVNNILVTCSYTMALYIALTALGIKYGDEVLLSPMACLVSTQPLVTMGLKIRWCDIDPNTGTLSPNSVIERITPNTKAIIHNHYCGNLGYIDEINEIGRMHHIPVIDDGIEAFGGKYKRKKLGNVGTDVTIFSFNPVRIPNTIEGGAIIFKNKDLYEKSILLRDNGIDRNNFRDDIGEINPECDITIGGYNATMSDVNAYIGIQQMQEVEEIIKKQRKNAKKWDDYFKALNEYQPIKRNDVVPNYWVYGILTNNKRETILKFRELGFYASSVHLNNNNYSVFGEKTSLPGVSEFYNKYVALPCGWWMDELW